MRSKLSQLKGERGPSGSTPLRSDGSQNGQAGGWILREAAKDGKGELESKGPSRKTGLVTTKRKLNLRFLRREIKLKMKMTMMMWCEPVSHKTE